MMKSMSRMRASLFIGGLMLTAGACWALQTSSKLFVEGQLASSDVRVINGQRYVLLKDVAAALHLHIVPQSGGINLTHEGGANQVEGLHGTVGDPKEIFTGKWRFWARSVEQTDEYVQKYNTNREKITARNAGETLVVFDCRIKNATAVKQEMILTVHLDGRSALTDDQEHSYAPFSFDAHNETGSFGGPVLLPGAAGEFAVIFSVPKGTNPKDLVYTITAYPGDGSKDGTDLRITIPKQ